MVDLRYRSKSGQAQHFRFSEPRPEDLRAGAFLFESAAAPSHVAARPAADSAFAAHGRDAPEERAFLEDSRPAFHRLHDSTRPHHVSAGSFQRAPAFGYVHAGPARHTGEFLALLDRGRKHSLNRREPLSA